MSDTFNTLSDALASFGVSLVERTRLTFGAPVLKALSEVPATGKVLVACKGGEKILSLPASLSAEAAKVVRVIDATDTEYAKVRPHVNTFAKGRKVPVTIGMIRDADDNPIAFSVTRKTK
jgi:hypothetical protein